MKILICTDGSEDARSAVRFGGMIAARLGVDAALMCVKTTPCDEALLEKEAALLQQWGVAAKVMERDGTAAREIPIELGQDVYFLVVVGYRSRGFVKRLFQGSHAIRIAQASSVSVLIVREPRDDIKRILIGVTGGGFVRECAGLGGRIATAFDAHVTLLHVENLPALMYAGLDQVVEPLEAMLQTDTNEARALKQAAAILTEMGVETDTQLVRGLAEREILRVAHTGGYDLLIVGSSWAAEPVQRLMLPSVTRQVLLHTELPILVVRP